MQMDAEFKKEQIGTLFCLVGALEGGFGGGGSLRGVHAKKYTCLFNKERLLQKCYIYVKKLLFFVTSDHFRKGALIPSFWVGLG